MSEKIHILYVDDDPDHLTVGKKLLERYEKFTVTIIAGAAQALDLLKTQTFDVIISDYQMTHMDGNVFLKRLRETGNTTPFIIFTGRGREEVVIEAFNNGVDFYLQKGGDVKAQFDYLTTNICQILSKRTFEKELARKNAELQAAYEKISAADDELRVSLEKLTIQEQKTRESEERLRVLSDNLPNGMMYQLIIKPDGTRQFVYVSAGVEKYHGVSISDALQNPNLLYDQILEEDKNRLIQVEEESWKNFCPFTSEVRFYNPQGLIRWALIRSIPRELPGGSSIWDGFVIDITDLKTAKEALEKRLLTLTQPLETGGITFEDLFNIQEIQQIQDDFANATGVASIITYPDGTPITKPSNFTRLCSDIIRKTERGCANCFKSDAIIGRPNHDGPIVQPCLSGGLWDAGASIIIGNQHIANWLIGQVRNETQSEETIRSYANQIGADEQNAIEAFREVPSMSLGKFQDIAKTLFSFANQLSRSAYQNIQQARYITEQIASKNEIQKKNDELQAAYEQISASEEELRSNFNRLSKQEQIIKIHEERLLMAQDIGRTGCWEYSIGENTIWGSAQGLHIFGFPKVAGDFPIDKIEDCILEKEKVHQALVDLLTKGIEYNLEYLIHPADGGKQKWIHSIARIEKDSQENPIRVLGVIQDITEQKTAELLLKETNEAFKQAQKIGRIGSWTYDLKSDHITWSDELFRIFGHEPGSLLLKLDIIKTTFHPEDLEKHDRILSTAITTHYYEPAEYRLIYPDGSLHYVNADGMVEVDLNGDSIRLIGVVQDITDQKLANDEILKKNFELQAAYEEIAASEEELRANLEEIIRQEDLIRESKERFQSLFDNMVEGAALHEMILTSEGVAEDYRIIEVNPAFERNLGLSRDSVIGKTSKDAYGVTEPPYLDIFVQVAMTGEPVSFETYYPPMEKYFAISVYCPYQRSFATIFEDITIRKNSEIALLETTAYLENLIHNANVPIIVWDPSFRITRLNQAFELLIGRSADEVMGTSLELMFSPEQAERSIQLLRTTMTGGRWDTTEIDIVHKDGTIRHLLWNSSTIYAPDGKTPVATIAQGQDITRERNLEQEKDAALTQVMQNLAYLSILNDEIRNPLTIISSCADLIDDALVNEQIRDQTQRIDTMVTQLDRRWIESEKILSYLRKHHQIHLTSSSDTKKP